VDGVKGDRGAVATTWASRRVGSPDLHAAFRRELARSRRNAKSVAVVSAWVRSDLEAGHVSAMIGSELRRYDVVGTTRRAVVAIVPDSGSTEAMALCERLRTSFPALAGVGLGVAVAPDDGDEFDELVALSLSTVRMNKVGQAMIPEV